ncbi:MAG: bifunctional phosphoribosylaminoimidazolecarboxamide formyltransferase/IMP cyclohydrolase [Xanthomonadaceae bacterium]|nr:bifunctional phosphoribosylaminoimidazolecarboxamide formyltransferase/IMP cyclohydrolase [Xanthomonadaceae bacterium]MDZ4115484.1 bifunctional phosphoribosylaminoimidazolecarboxamide formyltransferase/IMP cyclohydrolase [Xanthomonadaceae bacterium]MDZ4378370.1 bifunctional phosphoribosylaminoimidazolecarboxamide formyltransferase/IMP cyclohydrolase [Xanthomonadaceae bacterium]
MSAVRQPIRRALLSVSDKTGLIDLAQTLASLGVELMSTGGTALALRAAGIAVTDVSSVTGFPEIMDGRVKTLHPVIHGGLLGRAETDDAVMAEHGIAAIDLLVVNLYPFAATVSRADCRYDEAIENIDIGGPAMLRAAAKNHARVSVVVDPADYRALLDAIRAGGTEPAQRRALAAKAYAHTSRYDGQIAQWLSPRAHDPEQPEAWPHSLHLSLQLASSLRYGENPHQRGALYVQSEAGAALGTVAAARVLAGKALSYNNLGDADAALQCVQAFTAPACVIVKHANPCGVAVAEHIGVAYARAFATDPTSAFGGIIAFNRPLDAQTAGDILRRQFVEVVIAPEIDTDALALFASKPNVRVLATGNSPVAVGLDYQRIAGGLLVQDADSDALGVSDLTVVSACQPDAAQFQDLLFAWKVAMYVKSNAIVYARGQQTIGIGAGQMSRVISARIAGIKAQEAGLAVAGAVMASDAFFPFRDGIDAAAEAGIAAVIQPGGSMRDSEVIAAANEHGMAMVFSGRRHFRH